MADNAWTQVQWIAAEALNHLEDALIISTLAGVDKTSDFNVKPNGYAIGSTIDIRSNPVYKANDFVTDIIIQDIRSSKRQMKIEKHLDISAEITAFEKRMDFESFSEQVIKPAAYALALDADIYVGTKILEAAGLYVSSALFTDADDMAQVKKAGTFQQLSPTGRFVLMNDTLEAFLIGKTYFNTHQNRAGFGTQVFQEGELGRAFGMDFYSSLNFPNLTRTAGDGVGVTDNASSPDNKVGSKVLVTDSTTGTFEVGDHILVAGLRRPLICATQTVATATAIPLRDPITELIADGVAITVVNSGSSYTVKGALFDDASIAIASPILDPASDKPTSAVSNNGFSIRVVQGYDMIKKKEIISLDMLLGATAYDPRRITLLAE